MPRVGTTAGSDPYAAPPSAAATQPTGRLAEAPLPFPSHRRWFRPFEAPQVRYSSTPSSESDCRSGPVAASMPRASHLFRDVGRVGGHEERAPSGNIEEPR